MCVCGWEWKGDGWRLVSLFGAVPVFVPELHCVQGALDMHASARANTELINWEAFYTQPFHEAPDLLEGEITIEKKIKVKNKGHRDEKGLKRKGSDEKDWVGEKIGLPGEFLYENVVR